MSCFEHEEVECIRCKEKTCDGYNIIDGQVVCDECLTETELPPERFEVGICIFCKGIMSKEGDGEWACDNCGATYDDKDGAWTSSVVPKEHQNPMR